MPIGGDNLTKPVRFGDFGSAVDSRVQAHGLCTFIGYWRSSRRADLRAWRPLVVQTRDRFFKKGSGHGRLSSLLPSPFYTDNGDFFGGKTRGVAPLYSVQSGLSYTLAPGGWFALNAGYFKGGRTTVDEVENDDEQQGIRFGATLVLPVNCYEWVKLYSISGYNAHHEHDFQAFGIAWQYRWGGGF